MESSFSAAWLARHPVTDASLKASWRRALRGLRCPTPTTGSPLESALQELRAGLRALLGLHLRAGSGTAGQGLLLERGEGRAFGAFTLAASPTQVTLTASDDSGFLYGVFRLLELVATGHGPQGLALDERPHRPIRMIDHWDNLDGSVERGYAGRSLFFRDGRVLPPGPRLEAYARLMASIGINAVAVNNVNVHRAETELLTPRHLPALAKVAGVFRRWGIRLFLSANFASPLTLGELQTADPLDPEVIRWWQARARLVWDAIPDFGGFVVKADSEGRPGPFTYGRDHADGANLLARAVADRGGVIFWRCFVYNCLQDWRDRSTDRARAAYDHFRPLDGRFLPNVFLQIKNGPMDFQPREPVSPLFGAMPQTHHVLELQIAQEYTGQQRHLCFLPEQWRTYLDFSPLGDQKHRLSELVDGFAAVSNLGDDTNWTGHDLAQANWYSYGRLTWDPDLEPGALARDWAVLTFGPDPEAVAVVTGLLTGSWAAYEAYTAPLGVGWMVNPSHHYGPNPDGYEYDRWGTYHFADWKGIGVDRTTATGTGYAGQYPPAVAAIYENLQTCPDELLLFFHHVPYTHTLHSGKTVIQHIYDAHFEGAERAAALLGSWEALSGRVSEPVFLAVRERLKDQGQHAALWRDVINTYFWRKSGIADAQGRPMPR